MGGPDEHAEVQYLGVPGVTRDCVTAVAQILQAGERLASARILTTLGEPEGDSKEHCLLLQTQIGDKILIPSGFASGYGGEGPHGFSFVLALLMSLDIPIDEIVIEPSVQREIDGSCLLRQTLDAIENQPATPFYTGRGYVSDEDLSAKYDGTLWQRLDLFIPLGAVDPRLVDVARDFRQSPGEKLMTAFRRLEEDTRDRLKSSNHGERDPGAVRKQLFAKAFNGDSSPLTWEGIDPGEHQGRANLFTGAYMAYRNRRAHSEQEWEDNQELLREFFLVNHLFCLLRTAKLRTDLPTSGIPSEAVNEGN